MVPLEKLDVRPAYKVVFDEIERRIADGQLAIGDRLPTEIELSTTLGVNRSTVREGIRLLEENGLAERREGRRLFVTAPRAADLASRASRAMMMNKVTFRELWEVMSALEPMSARAAASRISERGLDRLRENLEVTRDALARRRPVASLDNQFHALIAEATGNRVLQQSRETIGPLLHAADDLMMPLVPQAGSRLVEAHANIVNALARRDPVEAGVWMARHIDDFRRGYDIAKLSMDEPVRLARRW